LGRRGKKKHVPHPAVGTCGVGVVLVDLCGITKVIAVLVYSLRQSIIQRDPINPEFRKRVKLVWFGDAVVVGINS